MKEEQYYYVDSDLHDLMTQKSVKNNELNTLKSDKINQVLINLFNMFNIINISKTIFWQNSEVLFSIINENVSISFEIQIHQNVNLNLINQVVTKYSVIWSETK